MQELMLSGRPQLESQGHLHARATLKNYCSILEIVKEKVPHMLGAARVDRRHASR